MSVAELQELEEVKLLVTKGNRDRVSVKPHAAGLEAIPSAPPVSQK